MRESWSRRSEAWGIKLADNMEINRIWDWLTKPVDEIREPEKRRQARLLSGLLIFFIPLTIIGIFSIPPDKIGRGLTVFLMLGALIAYLLAYDLSRTKYYSKATLLAVATTAVLPFLSFLGRADYSYRSLSGLLWMLLAILLSSILLSARQTLIIAVASVGGVLLLPTFITELTFRAIIFPLGFIFTVSALLLVANIMRSRDQKQIQQQSRRLFENEARLHTICANIPVALFAIDRQGIFTLSEGKGLSSLGFKPGQVVGRSAFEVYSGQPKILENIRRALAGEEFRSGVEVDGRVRECWYSPLFDEHGEVVSIISVVTDITERKKVEKRLKEYSKNLEKKVKERTRELEKSNRLKSEFIADASHELRTPLAIIKSNLDLALREKSKKHINPYEVLTTINEEVGLMSKIISDLVFLTRADTGNEYNMKYDQEFSLDQLVKKVADKTKVLGKDNNISVKIKRLDKINLQGHENDLEKLLMNLASNAVRYGKVGGRVQFALERGNEQVNITVTDNGIGIPRKDLPYIFERFYRVDKAHSRQRGGTGLGLAICRVIAETHGGSIKVESTEGMGSQFTVNMPFTFK